MIRIPKHTVLTALLVAAFGAAVPAAHAQTKIGMVDMNRVFSSYHKTKDAEARINEEREKAKTELNDRMEAAKKNIEEINKLNEELQSGAISADAKTQKERARDEKIGEAKNLDREINEFRQTRERQLQEQALRMRNSIVEEITVLVQEKVKRESYDLVFDRSGSSLNGVPIVVFSQDKMDFSEDIITALNKGKPAAAEAPAKKP